MGMIGLECNVKSCTFSKGGVDGTHGTRVFDFAKVCCTKESLTEVYLLWTT